ncbi:histidine kinase dimerization/phospho-acceptor domain-containing protein [Frigidibacter albus]|uniref:histidine kinase dimerization/phospho-acceptor domain-containing protein n=1 Tax=Frigidibacter albus TaxID=1465486 RepID=UPI001E38C80A|nr:histidine kinase dimerization/phospho-acceptor domain-containing protein [Frigidibacter albus]
MMAIVLGGIVLVAVIGKFSEEMLKRQRGGIMGIEEFSLSVSTAARLLAAKSPELRAGELAAWHAAGVDVALIESRTLQLDSPSWETAWVLTPGMEFLPEGFASARIKDDPVLIFRLDEDQVLLFPDIPQYLLGIEVISYILALVVLFAAFSALAVRGIAGPARRMADALSGTDRFLASGRPFRVEGPRELRALAHVLNDLRDLIRRLLESRNSMLRSVSHDLRTPLTRLQLRTERIEDVALRASVQNDIAQMDAMIETTLDYLRDGNAPLTFERCDLGSILTTICDD